MGDFVRSMHEKSGLLTELDAGLTLAEAEQQVLAYIREHCPDGQPAAAGRQHGRHRPLVPDPRHADARGVPALPDRRRLLDQGAVPALVPAGVLPGADQARQPPRPGRHPGEHRGAALLPRGRLRRPHPAPTATPPARSPRGTAARSPACPLAPPLESTPAAESATRPIPRNPTCSPRLLVGPGTSRGRMVGVAQLVERRVVVADVAGSSPVTHPRFCAGAPGGGGQPRASSAASVRRVSATSIRDSSSAEAAIEGIGGGARHAALTAGAPESSRGERPGSSWR